MTARVYRDDEWHPVSRDAADVIAIGAERVIDDGREVMDADPRVIRDLARTVVALRDAAPDCDTTHHAGCACHEARRDARERELVAEVKDLRTALEYFGGRDDERIDALESALRASLARWRAARGRYTPFPHCDVCGMRLAADGTETHDAECAVGRDLRVLGEGAT